MRRVVVAVVAATAGLMMMLGALPARAQTTSFLSEEEIRLLINEISGDRAFEHIRWLSHWHRDSGSEGYFKAVDYIFEQAKLAGLEDVKFIEQPLDRPSYKAVSAELWMVEPVEVKLADIGDCVLYLGDGSGDADVTAELVWIGDASEESLEGLDVAGKIVLTSGSSYSAVRNAVRAKGAVGVVVSNLAGSKMLDYPDQIPWSWAGRGDGEPTFAFSLPPRKGETLRRILEAKGEQDFFRTGTSSPGGRVVLHAKVDTEFSDGPGRTGFVEGWIKGTKYHDQAIVLTSHIQEEKTSANDDASGCANMLEFARVLNKLIEEGRIERPLRDIRFWWADEIYSEYRYFADNPGEPAKLLAAINQDMVGAKQSLGSRVQHLIYAPHSRTSYLDAVLESIGTYVIETNNLYLPADIGDVSPTGYKRAIYSTLGTREGYTAALVPYYDSSDHMCFVDGAIGVPAVGMINWDDDFIHSSGDDLHNVDPTQLARNNFIVSGISVALAYATPEDAFSFASETFSQGCRRLARDLAVGTRILRERKGEEGDKGWFDALNMIEMGVARELRAIDSLRVFAEDNSGAIAVIDAYYSRMKAKREQMSVLLRDVYTSLHGAAPADVSLTAEQEAAAAKVPVNIPDLAEYFRKRNAIHYRSGLHGLMRAEVYYFVDGKRSYWDIYRAVRAEALVAGDWYYGTVEFGDVVGALDAAVEAGSVTLR